jgi:hypothetical protein
MTRLKPGFYDSNGEFVTADARVEYRFGARHGTVNAIFQDGEAEVIFDDDAGLYLVNGITSANCRLGPKKHERLPLAIRPIKILAGRVW